MNTTQANLLLQHELLCCRVCLMLDCRLYNIHEYKLADTFTRISGTTVSRDRLPQYLCAYCLVLLLKCASFRDMCLRTLKQLTPALHKGALDTDYIRKYQLPHRSLNLTQTELETIDLLPSEDVHNVQDEHIVLIDNINKAYAQIKPEIQEDLINNDFEDEFAIKDSKISKRKTANIKTVEDNLKTKKTCKRQTEEIAARKKSESYLESPFKCEDCGKGFDAESAYNNHRIMRHSPSNGSHSCDICTSYYTHRRIYGHRKRHQQKYICNECDFVSRHG
ncbi:transcription factor Ouib-like [Cydia amplana]|uniref:transcription factor Ouib-like n=1 Tax=Cydia amplana TaxID=1869771 RepID=UPI002FE5A5F5